MQQTDVKNALAYLENCAGRAQMNLKEHVDAQAATVAIRDYLIKLENEVAELKRKEKETKIPEKKGDVK